MIFCGRGVAKVFDPDRAHQAGMVPVYNSVEGLGKRARKRR